MEKEGRAASEEPGSSVRISTPHSLCPHSPMVRSFRNSPFPKGGQEDSNKQ